MTTQALAQLVAASRSLLDDTSALNLRGREAAESASQEARTSTRELDELREILTSHNPSAAALRWVEKRFGEATGIYLRNGSIDTRAYVSRLVSSSFPSVPAPLRAELVNRLVTKADTSEMPSEW